MVKEVDERALREEEGGEVVVDTGAGKEAVVVQEGWRVVEMERMIREGMKIDMGREIQDICEKVCHLHGRAV